MDQAATVFLAIALIIIMLGMGMSLIVDDFKRIVFYPKNVVIGLINQLIFLPIIAFGLVSIFEVRAEIAIGIIILAACPGGAVSNLITHIAHGDTALSVTLTAASSFITILTIPFLVNLALTTFLQQDQMIQLDVVETTRNIFMIVLIPVCIGMLIRWKSPSFAIRSGKPVRIVSAIILLLVIIGIILRERSNFLGYFEEAGLIASALIVTTLAVGYLTSILFGAERKQAITISIESGVQNGTMAIAIPTVLLNNTSLAIAPAVYSLIMFFPSALLVVYGIRLAKSTNVTLDTDKQENTHADS